MAKIENQSKVTSKYQLPDMTEKQSETMSNVSTTENMTTSFLKTRLSAKEVAELGGEVQQTITLTNNSEFQIFDILVIETINDLGGSKQKENSLMIDGVSKPGEDIFTGIGLDPIEKNTSRTITYTLVIPDQPTQDMLKLKTEITYSVNEVSNLKEYTNESDLSVVEAAITINKTSDVTAVIEGGTITFMHEIKNEGNTKHTDLFFTDQLPQGVTFVPGSVIVDDVEKEDFDPVAGFNLGELDVFKTIIVKFDVTVNKSQV